MTIIISSIDVCLFEVSGKFLGRQMEKEELVFQVLVWIHDSLLHEAYKCVRSEVVFVFMSIHNDISCPRTLFVMASWMRNCIAEK